MQENQESPSVSIKTDATPLMSESEKTRPRILCVIDGYQWIFNRHVDAFNRYLGDEFEFIKHLRGDVYHESDYDLIYPLEFNMIRRDQIKSPSKYITGLRSFVAWADWDFLPFVTYLRENFLAVHAVSKQLFDLIFPYLPSVKYVTHGVDTAFFSPRTPLEAPAGRLRLGWAGNRKTHVKGFQGYIEPLEKIPGVELVYCGYSDRNLTYEEMPGFYDRIDAYISASSFEGNNNSLMEAASMERAIITTVTGTVTEYLANGQSALFVERNFDQIKSAVEKLRDEPDLRHQLGKNARESLLKKGWDWGKKAEEYRIFFRNSLALKDTPERISVSEPIIDIQHYSKVLETQFLLSRDLRIGYARQVLDLEERINKSEIALSRYEKLKAFIQKIHQYLYLRLSAVNPIRKLYRFIMGRK